MVRGRWFGVRAPHVCVPHSRSCVGARAHVAHHSIGCLWSTTLLGGGWRLWAPLLGPIGVSPFCSSNSGVWMGCLRSPKVQLVRCPSQVPHIRLRSREVVMPRCRPSSCRIGACWACIHCSWVCIFRSQVPEVRGPIFRTCVRALRARAFRGCA